MGKKLHKKYLAYKTVKKFDGDTNLTGTLRPSPTVCVSMSMLATHQCSPRRTAFPRAPATPPDHKAQMGWKTRPQPLRLHWNINACAHIRTNPV